MASITYDKEANAMYVKLSKETRKIKKTISLGEDRFMDVDDNGRIVGIEVLLPKSIPEEAKQAIYRTEDQIELVQ